MAIPRPSRRSLPGWVFVILFVAVLSFVVLFVVVVPTFVLRPGPRLGPPVLLIRATTTIGGEPTNISVPADFGPHCSKFRWDEVRRILTVEADVDLGGAEGFVLERFNVTTPGVFMYNGGDRLRTTVSANGTAWRLTSPVDSRTLAELVRQGDNVTFGGVTYRSGDVWSLQLQYEVPTEAGVLTVTERIAFHNEGVVRPHIIPTQLCL